MQRTKRLAFILLLTSALASLPALADEQERPGKPGEHDMQGMMQDMMGMMHGMMSGGTAGDAIGRERPQLSLALQNRAELGLTESQRKTLEGLVERFRGTAGQRMREIEAAEAELASLLKQDAAVGPQVEAKVRAIEKLRADLRLERIRTISEGRNALDSGQRATLDQIAVQSGRATMGGMGGSGMMGGGMQGMDHGSRGGSRGQEQKQ